MGALHSFEQRLEHMVTGAFARVFRSAVQPVEIAAALQREVDNSAQILSRDRRLAPNDFTIELSGTDYDRLSTYGQSLVSEMGSMMHGYAAEQHYVFAGPLQINFRRDSDLTTGRFRVRSAANATVTPAARRDRGSAAGAARAEASLEIGGERHRLDAPGVVIGRGSNADLRIDDPGISRRHVEFRVERADDGSLHLSVVDLGSTNGTSVDGKRVHHAVLHDSSRVQIGSTEILVRLDDQPDPVSSESPPAAPRPYPPSYQPPSVPGRQPPRSEPGRRPPGA